MRVARERCTRSGARHMWGKLYGAGAVKRTLTASKVALRRRRANVHADDRLHGYLRARGGHRRGRQEDRLQHAEVAIFWDERAAARMTLYRMIKCY